MANKKRYTKKEVQNLLDAKYKNKVIQRSNSPSMGKYRIECSWYDSLVDIVDMLKLEPKK